jgi:signal transduction histidine kinase
MLYAVIYWQTKSFETQRIAAFVVDEAKSVAEAPPAQLTWMIQTHLPYDHPDAYHNAIYTALFAADGHLIAGNIQSLPRHLPPDGEAHSVRAATIAGAPALRPIIAVARRLPDGTTLVIGRGTGVLITLANIVLMALLLGVIPAIGPALIAGIWLSRQGQRRVKSINQAIERIMQGDVQQRLPVEGADDDFDQLVMSVNRMLGEIERLLAEVQGVSDNIAHDLRTPLARVRTLLERSRGRVSTPNEVSAMSDRVIAGLDQAQGIITALLRIGEIEAGQRRSEFRDVDLAEIATMAADLYGPMAEEKGIAFELSAVTAAPVVGDRDLLIEAVVNLLDNAIKFTLPGGSVGLLVIATADGPVIRVSDNGPGIPPEERDAVMTRFYRVDKSRHVTGSGLGLSIVLAIVRLHDFQIALTDAEPGCVFELKCYPRVHAKPASANAAGDEAGKRRWPSPWRRRAATVPIPRNGSPGGSVTRWGSRGT